MIYLLIYKDLSNPYEHLRTFVGFDPNGIQFSYNPLTRKW
jgi:hypothetical protein